MAASIGSMSEVTVHVGGHVTLLFSVNSKQLLARNQGSKGAGFCLEDGVESTVRILDEGAIELLLEPWMVNYSLTVMICTSSF